MKIIADYGNKTLTIETVAGSEAPAFAQGKPVTYVGELTAESLLEANEYMEGLSSKSEDKDEPAIDDDQGSEYSPN